MKDTVIIIGAGFCGTLVTAHLLARGPAGLRVRLVERGGRFGPGVAYGRAEPHHLLNVPAGNMSAFPADPDHFVRFARTRWPLTTAGDFLPRATYGEYLERILADAEAVRPGVLERVTGEAVSLARIADGFRVSLADGGSLEGAHVVLAFGNLPPGDPLGAAGATLDPARYVRDPWGPAGVSYVEAGERVLLIGSGLTALDVALSAHARGAREIHCVSRHGWAPLPHRMPVARTRPTAIQARIDAAPATARGYLRCIRETLTTASRPQRVDWRDVIGGLRAVTPRLWQRLPDHERRRFLRHLRTLWDVHRHRCAHTAAAAWAGLRATDVLAVHAGRVAGVTPGPTGLDVEVRQSGGRGSKMLSVHRIVNCTGPRTDLARSGDALIGALLDRGLLVRDPLALGVQVDDRNRALDAHGIPLPGLHVVGPVLRARDWEATAVPELRGWAERVAEAILDPTH